MKSNINSCIGLKRIVVAFAFAALFVGQANLAMSDNFSLAGDASLNGSNIRLTSAAAQSGAAWRDASISTTNAFTAVFGFNLSYAPPDPSSGFTATDITTQADGIALVFQNVSNSELGGGGASLGVSNIVNASGSAIQTWSNSRVGFFQPGQDPASLTIKAAPLALGALGDTSPLTGTETVSYDPLSHIMSMTGSINGIGISDTMTIDLSSIYGPTVYIGFTGGSGLGGSDQEITDFRFTTTAPVPEPATMLLFGTGIAGLAAFGRRKRS